MYKLFPCLGRKKRSASGGERQMWAIGRAMMVRPAVLNLNEPSMGLAPLVVQELFEKIVEINKQGIPILLVEQNAKLALEISHYAYIIDGGRVILEGSAFELKHDPRVIEAYLGKFAKKQ